MCCRVHLNNGLERVKSATINFNLSFNRSTSWTIGVRSPAGAKDFFPLASVSRPALGPTQPPVQWVPGVKRGRGVTLTTHPNLVPRS
jgi:hypothetical protein